MGKIIAVGHTSWKMKRLLAMIAQSNPGVPYELYTVYNGEGFTPDLQVPNNMQGRDIAMYCAGLQQVKDDWAFFLNDDVCHLDDGWLLFASIWMKKGYDCVGCQPNLSHWVDYDQLNPQDLEFHKRRGRELQFVRTSHFAATRQWFIEGYQAAYGNAQAFEKGTLRGRVAFFPRVDWIYDGNTKPYV